MTGRSLQWCGTKVATLLALMSCLPHPTSAGDAPSDLPLEQPLISTNTPLRLEIATNSPPLVPRGTNAAGPLPSPTGTLSLTNLSEFQLDSSLQVVRVSPEGLVAAPVAMAFDEDGRLYVAEIPDFTRPDSRGAGRVRRLDDSDGDGVFDGSTILAENLNWPSAIAPYQGGVFVATTPNIIYLRDSDGDGDANIRQVVLQGFGGTNQPARGFLVGGLKWSLDHRLHGFTAGIGGDVTSPIAPHLPPVWLTGLDFSFDPRTMQVRPETGSASSGVVFDAAGRKFACDPARPLRQEMYEARYYRRNPLFLPAADWVDLLPPGGTLQRSAEPESVKPADSTNRPPSSGRDPGGSSVTNRPPTTRFTYANSPLIYRGGSLSTNFFGNALIPDFNAGIIHRVSLVRSNLTWHGVPAPGSRSQEFLSSGDPDFHPSCLVEGPSGMLYIADYRLGGSDGVIYRIQPRGFLPPKHEPLSRAKTPTLVKALSNQAGWVRESALRLIQEREDQEGAPRLLAAALLESPSPLVRLQALHALGSLNSITDKILLIALRDPDDRVRETAVVYAEYFVRDDGAVHEDVWAALRKLCSAPSPTVRYQLAFTLGFIAHSDRADALIGILAQDLTNEWVQTAVLSSLHNGASDLLLRLARQPTVVVNPVSREFYRQVAGIVGLQARPNEIPLVFDYLIGTRGLSPMQTRCTLGPIAEGIHRTGGSMAAADPSARLFPLFQASLAAAAASASAESLRLESARMLAAGNLTYGESSDLVFMQLSNPRLQQATRQALLAVLARYDEARLGTNLLSRWHTFPPETRSELVTALLGRVGRVPWVMQAIAEGVIPRTDLTSFHVNLLRTYPNLPVRHQALALFGNLTPRRPAAVEQYATALNLKGNTARGREVFLARCLPCHLIADSRPSLGPNLGGARAIRKDSLLRSILEPGAEIRRGQETWILQTGRGELLAGTIERQTSASILLKKSHGERQVWPTANLQFMEAQSWSLMPDALELGLTPQAMADLLEFLTTTD